MKKLSLLLTILVLVSNLTFAKGNIFNPNSSIIIQTSVLNKKLQLPNKIEILDISVKVSQFKVLVSKLKEQKQNQPIYVWLPWDDNCWQLCVMYQENGQTYWGTVNAPPYGGYIGTTQICLDQELSPGSPYNSFNSYC